MDLSKDDEWVEIYSRSVSSNGVSFSPPFFSPYLKIFCSSKSAKDTWKLAGWISLNVGNIQSETPVKFRSKRLTLNEWRLITWDGEDIHVKTTQLFYTFKPPHWIEQVDITVMQHQSAY